MSTTIYEGDLPTRFPVLSTKVVLDCRVWDFVTVIKSSSHEYTLKDGNGSSLVVTPYFFKTKLMDMTGRLKLLQRASGNYQLVYNRHTKSLFIKVL